MSFKDHRQSNYVLKKITSKYRQAKHVFRKDRAIQQEPLEIISGKLESTVKNSKTLKISNSLITT